MAEPFSIVAGAAGLADVAVKTSVTLRRLISDFKHAPDLILALSNEAVDIGIVIERVAESGRSLETLGARHDTDFVSELEAQLNTARALLSDLASLASMLKMSKSSARRFKWIRRKEQANTLKDKLRKTRDSINDLLVAHNISIGSRARLELQDVRIAVQGTVNHHAANAVIGTRQVQHQLSQITDVVTAGHHTLNRLERNQNVQFETMAAMQSAIFRELAVMSDRNSLGWSTSTETALGPALAVRTLDTSVIFFSMRLPGSGCAEGCRCKCHLPARADMSLQTPSILRTVLGNLFLGYTGYPTAASRCNITSCRRGKYMRLQVTYAFPLWFLRYGLHAVIEGSMAGTLTFALVARRRMRANDPQKILYQVLFGAPESLERMLQRDRACLHDVFYKDARPSLALAIGRGSIDAVKLLLQYGADPDQEDDFGLTPRLRAASVILTHAMTPAFRKDLETVFPLSSSFKALDMPYLHKIVLGIISMSLEEALLDFSISRSLNVKDTLGLTPLMYAACEGNSKAVSALINAGAEVNTADKIKYTPLYYAIKKGQSLDCVAALLYAGADPNLGRGDGWWCLEAAVVVDHVPIGRKLIEAGVDIHVRHRRKGRTILHSAAQYDAVDMVRFLIDGGVSVNTPNRYGQTPIFCTIGNNAKRALVLLLDFGADSCHISGEGNTLLHHVALYSSSEEMRSFLDVPICGLDSMIRNKHNRSARDMLGRRRPGHSLVSAFDDLEKAWCRPMSESGQAIEDGNECFYDAVEVLT